MKTNQYHVIRHLAREHILEGGGILPTDAIDGGDSVTVIANAACRGRTADHRFDRSIAGLDRRQQEEIYTAAWELVCAYQDAAYTFGAAVGLQLHGLCASRKRRRTARRLSR